MASPLGSGPALLDRIRIRTFPRPRWRACASPPCWD